MSRFASFDRTFVPVPPSDMTSTAATLRLLRRITVHSRGLCTKSSFSDANPQAAEAEALITNLEPPVSRASNIPALQKAAELARIAVDAGSPRGKTLLASMHREGLGADQDRSRAATLFREAAVAGDPVAQCSLGALLLTKQSDEAAVAQSELTVAVDDSGEHRGSVQLRREDGSIVEGDQALSPAEMVRRVRKARRKAGFSDAQAMEFEQHREELERQKKANVRTEALEWLERAVEQGNDEAMVLLANEVWEEDALRAEALYRDAVAAARNTDAYFNLGHLYTHGAKGVDKDARAASLNFAMAAQLGDASAQFYLGHLYRVGTEHIEADSASARQYVELAASQHHPAATYYLALMHRNGEGGLEASEGAFRRYVTKAAELGHGPAHACLGDMYYKGTDGMEVDYKKALQHFLEAGALGEGDAYCSAAAMVFHGLGTKEDHHEAFLLYQEAAQLGSLPALRNIGSMYFHGQGVPANKKVAAHFFEVADQLEAKRQSEADKHMSKPVRTTEAPKHPMADIPRSIPGTEEDEHQEVVKYK